MLQIKWSSILWPFFRKWEKWNFNNFHEPSLGLPVLQPFVARLLLDNACCVNHQINPRIPKGGGYYPPNGLSPIAPKRKTKWPQASIKVISLYSLRSFWWKKYRGYPLTRGGGGVRVSRQSPKVRGWLSPEDILSHHFEKYLHDMDLKFTEHVRNAMFLLNKQKTRWNSDIRNFFSEKIKFGLYSPKNRHFQVSHVLLHHCDVIRWRYSWF